MIFHFDFETFSVPKLGQVGSWAYASHPDADIVSASWAKAQDNPDLWSPLIHPVEDPRLDTLFQALKQGAKLAAWNVTFEYTLWNKVACVKYGWPKLRKTQIFDVQALALVHALPPDLDTAAKILKVENLKDASGKRLIDKLSKPRRQTKNNSDLRWSYDDAKAEYDEFFEYNKQDVIVERDIYNRLKSMPYSTFEHHMWLMTLEQNEKGVPVDRDTAHAIVDVLQQYETKLTQELVEITDGAIQTSGQRDVTLEFLLNRGLELPDMRKDTVAEYLENPTVNDDVVNRVLEIRQLLGRSSVQKFQKLVEMVSDDGCVHNILRYHNSTTGRWGSSGMQIHNMPRAEVEDPGETMALIRGRDLDAVLDKHPDIKGACAALVRPIIKSKPGHRILVADYSAIEAIVIAWTVGEETALRVVRSGKDIYRWFATVMFPGTAYDEVTKHQRNHAKVCLLGLGYQMGAPTFIKSSLGYGIEVSEDEAQRLVQLYRRTFPNVVKLWYGLEKNAIHTVRTGQSRHYGRFSFTLEHGFLKMHLPGGRKLAYPKPRYEQVTTPWGTKKMGLTCWKKKPNSARWARLSIAPGRFTENAIQAIARDILAQAQWRLRNRGYDVLFSVHDEIVAHNRIDFGNLDDMISIMCDTDQTIYPGLPIKATGFVTNRYTKG